MAEGGSERRRHFISLAATARRIYRQRAFDPPFNGQQLRLRTVRALIRNFSPDAIVETGTFLGDTTRFFSDQGVPVHSIEVKHSHHWVARLRFATDGSVRLIRADSRTGLAKLARERPFERPLAYLDAHWWADLPLEEEVGTLFSTWPDALAVIDDFRVPGDDGYSFDAYGDATLSIELLDLPTSVIVAYPGPPASEETGLRRGAGFLAQGPHARGALETLIGEGLLRSAA